MRAITSFHALGRFVAAGEDLPASDEIVKAFPSLFVPGDDDVLLVRPASVDGSVTRPAKKAAARKAAPKVDAG
jgi:hypothetical protein